MKYIIKILIVCIALSVIYADMVRPVEGQRLNYLHIPFEWDQEASASNYNLQVSSSSDFNTLVADINTSNTLYLLTDGIDWESNLFLESSSHIYTR